MILFIRAIFFARCGFGIIYIFCPLIVDSAFKLHCIVIQEGEVRTLGGSLTYFVTSLGADCAGRRHTAYLRCAIRKRLARFKCLIVGSAFVLDIILTIGRWHE